MKEMQDCVIYLKGKSEKTLEESARAYLKEAATEVVFHVALSKSLIEDLAQKFGVTKLDAGGLLSKAAVEMVAEIRGLR